jgi:tight adherence protein C
VGTMMFLIVTGFACLFSCGTYLVAANSLGLPTLKASKAAINVIKRESRKDKGFEVIVIKVSSKISKYIKLDEYKKKKLMATLKSAGISLSPETYIARAWVKPGMVLLTIPFALMFLPILAYAALFLSIMVYFKEIKSAEESVKKRREAIENELPRFAMTMEQELKASRDVLRILETYKKNAGSAFRNELDITTADMKSGSYEAALSRFETRVGSTMLSDVVRGLLSVLRGDDGRVYFQMLSHDFKLLEIQKLKLLASKRPGKVRKYSFFMLGCFVLMYMAVMAVEIVKALSGLF